MDARLVVDDPAARASLRGWLRRAGDLRVSTAPQVVPPGEMGVGEVLVVALGAGGALSVLANALSVWLGQPRRPTVTVSVERPDGTRVEITGEHVRTPDEVTELLRAALHEDD